MSIMYKVDDATDRTTGPSEPSKVLVMSTSSLLIILIELNAARK